jgi:hypothetical protein
MERGIRREVGRWRERERGGEGGRGGYIYIYIYIEREREGWKGGEGVRGRERGGGREA